MNIKFKNSNYELEIEGIKSDNYDNFCDTLATIIGYLTCPSDIDDGSEDDEKPVIEDKKSTSNVLSFKNVKNSKDTSKDIKDERPIVRDRLPNEVDLSDVDLKNVETSEPMLRCPLCGQSKNVIVIIKKDENYYLVRRDNDEYQVIAKMNDDEIDGMMYHQQSTAKDFKKIRQYSSDIEQVTVPNSLKGIDIVTDSQTELLCPICGKKYPTYQWIDAYKNPLLYGFETECLCDVCGSEAVITIGEDKIEHKKCECCGYETIVKKDGGKS